MCTFLFPRTTNRKDCASTFVLTVQLLDKDLKELDCCKKENHEAQWAGGEWIEVMRHNGLGVNGLR